MIQHIALVISIFLIACFSCHGSILFLKKAILIDSTCEAVTYFVGSLACIVLCTFSSGLYLVLIMKLLGGRIE